MPEATSALGGAAFDGNVAVRDAGLRGMVAVRGDLASPALRNAATRVAGAEFPDRGEARFAGESGICWMSPDEILILRPYGEAGAAVAAIGKALAGEHHLAADVSDARALFRIEGAGARETLAKLTPADVSPERFGTGQFRRTRLAQAPAAFWMRDERTFEIVCFRSMAEYVFGILKLSASPGSEVGYF